MTAELQNKINTLEAEVARLKQAVAQAGDNIELQEAEQRGFLRGQATPLSAQEAPPTPRTPYGEHLEPVAKAIAIARTGTHTPSDMDWLIAKTLSASGLLSTERERGLEEA